MRGYLKRSYSKKIRQLSGCFPVVVLTGARQSGKTTLIRHLFPDYSYVSLDLPGKAAQAENNPHDFLRENPPPLIVDEVQYAPQLFRHLKSEVDRKRQETGRFILMGSQQFPLMQEVADSLAGRCAVLELENLSYEEISSARREVPDLFELLVRGQFPELWRQRELPSGDFYVSYSATYLERDVRQIMNVRSLRNFERFIRVVAARSGNMFNMSEVARDVGVSVKAVGDWISVLEASGKISFLEPWYANFGKRLVKTPKVYFRDSGLLCFLLGIDKTGLSHSPFRGAVWESFVFAELRKRIAGLDNPGKLWYYRDQRNREVDFIYEKNGVLDFLECKWHENPGEKAGEMMIRLTDELDTASQVWKSGKKTVLSTGKDRYQLGSGVMVAGYNCIGETVG